MYDCKFVIISDVMYYMYDFTIYSEMPIASFSYFASIIMTYCNPEITSYIL